MKRKNGITVLVILALIFVLLLAVYLLINPSQFIELDKKWNIRLTTKNLAPICQVDKYHFPNLGKDMPGYNTNYQDFAEGLVTAPDEIIKNTELVVAGLPSYKYFKARYPKNSERLMSLVVYPFDGTQYKIKNEDHVPRDAVLIEYQSKDESGKTDPGFWPPGYYAVIDICNLRIVHSEFIPPQKIDTCDVGNCN